MYSKQHWGWPVDYGATRRRRGNEGDVIVREGLEARKKGGLKVGKEETNPLEKQ